MNEPETTTRAGPMPTLRTHYLPLRVFLEPGPVLEQAVTIVRTVAWSVVLLGWSNVLVGASAWQACSGLVLQPS